ncbi:MAG: cytochrome c biogenesis protein CcdA [Bacteroidales bacterium]|nr:cytochrome c biogenesis protein CcdA [Bacteroidales bacterium]
MRRLTRYIALIAMALLAAAGMQAQRPVHVKWSTEVDYDGKGKGVVRWTADIDAGWHIYGMTMPTVGEDAVTPEPTSFSINPVPGLTLDGPVQPSVEADVHFDESLKLKLPWWEGRVTFTQPFTLDAGTTGAVISGKITYMACTDKSCTPPTREPFEVTVGSPAPASDTAVADESHETAAVAPGRHTSTDESRLWAPVEMPDGHRDDVSSAESPWWALLGWGFLGGLVALLTPCVWPMIPMTMSFFLKKGKSRRRAIIDAVSYGLSIIVIYLVLGIALTVIFGAGKLNEIATSAVFNVLFFVLLVIFAISFFGAFDIKLPSRWSNAIDSKAEATTGLLSIFFMAFTLVLVSFSCTGPIIGTLLVEAASEASILGPAVGMGGFALGLSLPFGLFAFFPSLLKEMPRSGSWLNTVKVVLGFIELILSLKFLSVADLAYGWRILDREVFLAIWIVLFVLLGIYLLGKLQFSHDTPTGHVGVFRFFLAVASLSFAVYLLPGMWGAPLKAVSAFAPPLSTQDFNLYGGTFKEFHDYDEGMRYARENNLPALVDFSGYACVNCRKMEGSVFDTDDVRNLIESDYVLIKLMVDDKARLDEPYTVEEYGGTTDIETVGDKWSYLQRHKFGINSQPYYVILDNDGKPLAPSRAYDENVTDFIDWLVDGSNNYKSK